MSIIGSLVLPARRQNPRGTLRRAGTSIQAIWVCKTRRFGKFYRCATIEREAELHCSPGVDVRKAAQANGSRRKHNVLANPERLNANIICKSLPGAGNASCGLLSLIAACTFHSRSCLLGTGRLGTNAADSSLAKAVLLLPSRAEDEAFFQHVRTRPCIPSIPILLIGCYAHSWQRRRLQCSGSQQWERDNHECPLGI